MTMWQYAEDPHQEINLFSLMQKKHFHLIRNKTAFSTTKISYQIKVHLPFFCGTLTGVISFANTPFYEGWQLSNQRASELRQKNYAYTVYLDIASRHTMLKVFATFILISYYSEWIWITCYVEKACYHLYSLRYLFQKLLLMPNHRAKYLKYFIAMIRPLVSRSFCYHWTSHL